MRNHLNILFEDSHIIVCEKPHGTATQSRNISSADMVSLLKNHIRKTTGTPDPYLAVIHRLDQPVRGILVFAKNQVAAARLWKQKEEGIFWKEYLAVCEGDMSNLEKGRWYTIDSPIGKMEGELIKMCVTESGLQAVTHFQVIRVEEDLMGQRGQEETEAVQADQKCSEESRSVLMDQERILYMSGQKTDVSHIRGRIDTGRTPQIRVHMASFGYP